MTVVAFMVSHCFIALIAFMVPRFRFSFSPPSHKAL